MKFVLCYLLALVLSVGVGWIMVPWLRKRKAGQPILGYVKAGYDLFANENLLGYEEVSAREAAQGDYYLRVQGDSMTGSRIYDGDLVYVKSCSDVENGDIAVVLLNHSEVTIKKILKKEHTVILMATNPVVEPRVFTQEEIE